MPRALLILLISCVYVGCLPSRSPELKPSNGGELRWAVDDARWPTAVARNATRRPLVGDATRQGIATEAANGPCRTFVFVDDVRMADGEPPRADLIVRQWESAMLDPLAEHRWLLAPIEGAAAWVDGSAPGVAGLRARDDGIAICPTLATPDLDARLAHPALWVDAVGPFAASGADVLVPRPRDAGPAPYLERVRHVPGENVGLLARLDEVDLALVWGAEAGRFSDDIAEGITGGGVGTGAADAPSPDWQLVRAPGWDRLYSLTFDPGARWVNDPRLRRWLSDRIDRAGLVRYLFDDRATPATTLAAVESDESDGSENGGPWWEPIPRRPLSNGAVPRIPLHYDRADPRARAIAARLKGEVQPDRIRFELQPRDRRELLEDLAAGRAPAAIVAPTPYGDDPLLRLVATTAPLGPSAADARRILDGSRGLVGSDQRADAARAAERVLLEAATVVPLVRVEAWLATRTGLVGAASGPPGVLPFERMGWKP